MPVLRTSGGIPMVSQGGAPLRPAEANSVVNPPSQPVTPTIVSITPAEPGALTETTAGAGVDVTFTVVTTGITSLGWAVVQNDASYTWRSSGTVATGGSVAITANFRAAGDFFKVYNAADPTLTRDTPGVSSFTAAGGGTTNPPPTGGGEGTVYEDFSSNTTGILSHRHGDTHTISVSNGEVSIGGTSFGAGAMEGPWGRDVGHSYGLYEMRIQLRGDDIGDVSGPCALLWPSDDVWPGHEWNAGYASEIDIGELAADGRTYFATHWWDSGWRDNNAYRAFWIQDTFPDFNQYDWHVFAVFVQRDKLTYYCDNTVVGVDTWNPGRAYIDGGVNWVMGVMNRSSQTSIKADWVRFTPEATVLANGGVSPPPGGGTTTPPGGGTGSGSTVALEPTSLGTVTQSGAGVGATVTLDIVSTGTSSVSYVVVTGAPSYTYRDAGTAVATTGRVTVSPRVYATGDFVKAWNTNNTAVYADSSPVVVNTATGGGGTTPPATGTGGVYDPVSVKRGWPLNNNQFEYFAASREWEHNFIHPTQGFAGIRWQPTWKRADGFYGSWEPAEVEVYHLYRKGSSGQDAQTLVLECGPNPASVPAGDKMVLFQVGDYNGSVVRNTSMNLNGFNIPMRQKLNVLRSQGSTTYDTNGRQRIEIDVGSPMPAIDHWTGDSAGGGKDLRVRHWSFYKNGATKELRHPLGWFKDLSITDTVSNGGYIMLGGLQGQPTWYDWTEDYRNFGASLVEELWRMECQGLADYFGSVDPAKVAVELENEPTREWSGTAENPGYGDLLPDVWYGMARQIWGSDRTLVVKGTNFGGLDDLLATFNFTNPTGHRTHLVTHNYDGQPHYPNGGSALNWGDIGQTNWYAQQLKAKITQYGYTGGGMTEFGAGPHEWWDYNVNVDDAERGRRHGRMLTSLTNQGLYLFPWGSVGDNHNASGIYNIDGHNIEAYHPGLRPYANRSGATTT